MGSIVFACIAGAIGACFTAIGIYARKRKEPMWFWSGSTVGENEISDVPAYNRANGNMWLFFSAFFWLAAVFGLLRAWIGGVFLAVGCIAGIPLLPFVYGRIYEKYRKK